MLSDIEKTNIINVIDLATKRGAWLGEELLIIGMVRKSITDSMSKNEESDKQDGTDES